MMRKITPTEAGHAYYILVRHAGARPDPRQREAFVYHTSRDDHPCTEYRFCGHLGFGGKFRNNGNRATPYVDCYREHENAERLAVMASTNAALADLFAQVS